jgi:hypothetical protein
MSNPSMMALIRVAMASANSRAARSTAVALPRAFHTVLMNWWNAWATFQRDSTTQFSNMASPNHSRMMRPISKPAAAPGAQHHFGHRHDDISQHSFGMSRNGLAEIPCR